jgi:S1-C subfamily serine protease
LNQLDLFIVIGLLAAAMWGWATGVATQLGVGIGTVFGLFAGATIAPHTATLVSSAAARLSVTLVTVLIVTTLFSVLGRLSGRRFAQFLHRRRLGTVERGLGVAVAVGTTLFAFWLLAVSMASTSLGRLGELIQGSAIVGRLDAVLPPVPTITSRLSSLIDPAGFTRVFAGLEPRFSAPVADPNSAEVTSITNRVRASMVKIEGIGCGGVLDGSGFVADNDLVVTNAHVVAGVRSPTVLDDAGRHAAVVVGFNPNFDIAVLRVSGLAGEPLAFTRPDAERAATGAVLGYPGGGPFASGAAAVRTSLPAVGRDIYGQGLVTRTVYELQARVRPGNSGGPFVLASGEVAGVVFARSVSDDNIGYALAASEVTPLVTAAASQTRSLSTGACVND